MTKFNFSKKFFWGLVISGILVVGFSFAQAATYDFPAEGINTSIPGMNDATQENPNPVGIIGNIFQFALLIGGLLAFVMIVYGGIEYAASGDSGSGQKEAKDRILQALLGLLLLAGSFILLNTINPQLTKLEFPTLKQIKEVGVGSLLPDITGEPGTVAGSCVPGTGTGCNEGLLCNPQNVCYKPADCPNNTNAECVEAGFSGYTCVDKKCTKPLKTCTNTKQHCSFDQTCVGGFCKNNGTVAGSFSKNGDCVDGLEPSSAGICITPGTCIVNADCEGSKECFAGACVNLPTSAIACELPASGCPNGLGCVLGTCNNCANNESCSQGTICATNGRCLPPTSNVQCKTNSNCPSGYACDSYGECKVSPKT